MALETFEGSMKNNPIIYGVIRDWVPGWLYSAIWFLGFARLLRPILYRKT